MIATPEDARLATPYPVERFAGRRHLRELDTLVVIGDIRAARKRTRAAVYRARFHGNVARLPVILANGPEELDAALEQLSAREDG